MSFINTFQDSRDFILLTFYNQGRLDILYCCSFNLMNLFEREREKNLGMVGEKLKDCKAVFYLIKIMYSKVYIYRV